MEFERARTGVGRLGWMIVVAVMATISVLGGAGPSSASEPAGSPGAPAAVVSPTASRVSLGFTANRTTAKPGDRLVFTATVTNRSTVVQSLSGTITTPTSLVLWSWSDWCAPWPGQLIVACYGAENFQLQPGERRSFFVEMFVKPSTVATTLQVRAAFGAATPVTLRVPVSAGTGVRPQAPRDLEATMDGPVWLRWRAPVEIGSSGITDYVVQRARSTSGPWTTLVDGTHGGLYGSRADHPAGGGAGWWYRVAAVNVTGTGPFSTPVAVRLPGVPSAPRSVTLSPNGAGGELVASWQAPAYVGSLMASWYVVQLSGDAGATWSPVALQDGYPTSVRIRNLRPGRRYIVRVAKATYQGRGPWASASASVPALPAPPSAPRLTATVLSTSEVRLTWTAPTSINGAAILEYAYQRSADGGRTWTTGFAGGATSRSATMSGLRPGVNYQFRLRARNSVGLGAVSNVVSAVPALRPPSAPTLSATVIGSAQVQLAWTAPVTDGGAPISSYLYQRSTDGGRTWTSAPSVYGRSVVADGLVSGRTYQFRVRARTSVGLGAVSNVVSAVPAPRPPSAPTLSATVLGSTQVQLSWTAPAATGGSPIVAYLYQRSADGGLTWTSAPYVYGRSIVVDGLVSGRRYQFRVRARTSVGLGAVSNVVSVVPAQRPPSAPTLTATVVSPTEVQLAWTPPVTDGGSPISAYVYERSADGGVTWTSADAGDGSSRSVVVANLVEGDEYRFRLRAKNARYWGAFSNVVSVSVPPATSTTSTTSTVELTTSTTSSTTTTTEPSTTTSTSTTTEPSTTTSTSTTSTSSTSTSTSSSTSSTTAP